MRSSSCQDVTQLLVPWSAGNRAAAEPLIAAVYAELNRLARSQLARERGHTLQPTALVHEAYMKLVDQRSVQWQNRAHFFGIAAQLMRRIVLKRARRRAAAKRGGGLADLNLDDASIPAAQRPLELIALDAALTRLATMDARQSQVVELRYFGGLDIDEIVDELHAATRSSSDRRRYILSVERLWRYRANDLPDERTSRFFADLVAVARWSLFIT